MYEREERIYHLNIHPNNQTIIDALRALADESDDDDAIVGQCCPYMAMAEYVDMDWPNIENTMREISRRFPDVSFEVESQGRSFHDLWKKVFLNGEMKVYQGGVSYYES